MPFLGKNIIIISHKFAPLVGSSSCSLCNKTLKEIKMWKSIIYSSPRFRPSGQFLQVFKALLKCLQIYSHQAMCLWRMVTLCHVVYQTQNISIVLFLWHVNLPYKIKGYFFQPITIRALANLLPYNFWWSSRCCNGR